MRAWGEESEGLGGRSLKTDSITMVTASCCCCCTGGRADSSLSPSVRGGGAGWLPSPSLRGGVSLSKLFWLTQVSPILPDTLGLAGDVFGGLHCPASHPDPPPTRRPLSFTRPGDPAQGWQAGGASAVLGSCWRTRALAPPRPRPFSD